MSGVKLEQSHGAPRATLRPDDVPALPETAGTDADRDPMTGRFTPANGAARARAVRKAAQEQRLLGLDPERVAPWMKPFVEHARGYAALLAARAGAGELSALAGDVATAETVYRALLAAATSGELILWPGSAIVAGRALYRAVGEIRSAERAAEIRYAEKASESEDA